MRKYFGGILALLACVGYSQSVVREQQTLNANWKFRKGDINVINPAFDDPAWKIVNLPHSWNTDDVHDEKDGYYQGLGSYSKTFKISDAWKEKKVFIFFEAANQVAEVYVNGNFVGRHKGGYTAFCFDITDKLIFSKNNLNEIAVKVDNAPNPTIPPLSGDFTFFGGIYRDVWLIVTNKIHFNLLHYASNGVYINAVVSREKAQIKINGSLINESEEPRNIKVLSVLYDANLRPVAEIATPYKVEAGKTLEFGQEIKAFPSPKLWSPEQPYLYTMVSRIVDAKTEQLIDEVVNPVGFRYYTFDAARGFYLNDKKVKLMGANRHQDYPHMGNAVPDHLHRRDIELLKEMGANFLRIAHYPQDKAVVDACDKMGILASIEIPVVNSINENDEFYANTKNMLMEMIYQYRNNPSIIIWGIGNEVLLRRSFDSKSSTDISAREQQYFSNLTAFFQNLHDICKKEDPLRPTMIVNHGKFALYERVKLTGITDIVGWNLYQGWYHQTFADFDAFLDMLKAKVPDKPIIITEYGAGADVRIRANNPARFDFSVEYLTLLHQHYYKTIRDRAYVAGGVVWNFIDFNSEGRIDANPHINNKGLLTQYREPKDAYYFYKANLSTTPFIKLTPVLYDRRAALADSGKNTSSQKVVVFTNLDKVELLHNRRILEKKEVKDGMAVFDVAFVDGENLLEAIGVKETRLLKDFQQIHYDIIPFDFKSKNPEFRYINVNAGEDYYFIDNYGQVFLPDKAYQKSNYGYVGGKDYMRWMATVTGTNSDIFGTENDPLYQTQRDSLEAYIFDVPQGYYQVTLHFAELATSMKRKTLIYNLGADGKSEEEKMTRTFTVEINGKKVLIDFSISSQIGDERACSFDFFVTVIDDQGIRISFIPVKGNPVINALQVRKLF